MGVSSKSTYDAGNRPAKKAVYARKVRDYTACPYNYCCYSFFQKKIKKVIEVTYPVISLSDAKPI